MILGLNEGPTNCFSEEISSSLRLQFLCITLSLYQSRVTHTILSHGQRELEKRARSLFDHSTLGTLTTEKTLASPSEFVGVREQIYFPRFLALILPAFWPFLPAECFPTRQTNRLCCKRFVNSLLTLNQLYILRF